MTTGTNEEWIEQFERVIIPDVPNKMVLLTVTDSVQNSEESYLH